jgi:heme/copper-type cytochrome/quinol oxidase subunit 1
VVGALRRWGLIGLGGLLLIAGIAVWVLAQHGQTVTFGWYMYSPLERVPRRYADYLPDDPLVSAGQRFGLLLAGTGLLGLASGVGYRLGFRAAQRRRTPEPSD